MWLVDVVLIRTHQHSPGDWLPVVSGMGALWLVLAPEGWLSVERRAWLAAGGSTVVTMGVLLWGWTMPDWGLLEGVCLLVLLTRTCRRVERPRVAVALAASLGLAVLDEPVRSEGAGLTLTYPFLLTFAIGAAVGTGCYLRWQEEAQARAFADIRHAERIELARELHDFVAHHVTGIVAQAHAAEVLRTSSPHHIGPLLRNIAEAGQQTMESMRRLVRVLRDEQEDVTGDPKDLLHAQLARLVAAFSDHGDGSAARLEITAPARRTRPTPEEAALVHSVVRESLTNVRRHAVGAEVTVRLHRTRTGRFRVDVHNTAVPRPASFVTPGGQGGYGLLGLRECVEKAGGTFTAGPSDDGGWWVVVHVPTASGSDLRAPAAHRALRWPGSTGERG